MVWRLLVVHLLSLWLLTGCSGHGRARELIAAGQYRQGLQAIEGKDKEAYRLRGLALRALGRRKEAAGALRLGLRLDGHDERILGLLGQTEAELGEFGAALRHLERAVELGGEKRWREALARLLWMRGALRRRTQPAEAGGDFSRAHGLGSSWPPGFDAARWARERQSLSALDCGGARKVGAASRPASRAASRPTSRAASRPRSSALARCDLQREKAVLLRALAGRLWLACDGEHLLSRFHGAGCFSLAVQLAEELRRESPRDPRWPLALARAQWLGGRPERAKVLLEEHLFLSKQRAEGALRVARMLLSAGARRNAAAWAIRALAFDREQRRRAAVVRILRESGHGHLVEKVDGAPTSQPVGASSRPSVTP